MSYTVPLHIPNGLALDFSVEAADTANDNFLAYNTDGELTSFSSIPRGRISGGGNLTESTSSVLTITGGSGAILTSGLTIQVKVANTSQSGYLSSADWNTFNGKISPTLTSAHILVGNGSNVATSISMTGDIGIDNSGVTSITAGVIVNADINSSAEIAQSKMAALTASLVMATDGSGFATTVTGLTTTLAGYLTTLTGNVQTQLNSKDTIILGLSGAGVSTGAGTTGYAITWDNPNNRWTLSPIGAGGSVTGPGSSTSTAIVRWNGIGGTSLSNSGVLIDGSNNISGVTTLLSANGGLRTIDGSGTYYMAISAGSTYTAARTLTLTTGDASRTITLSGNPTLADWFDQSVKTTADPIFNSATANNSGGLRVTDVGGSFYMLITTSSTYTAARTLTLVTGDSSRTLTINASGTVYVTGGTDVALADGGTGSSLSDPGANRLWGWDDTDNTIGFWTIGSGLTYTHSTHTLSSSGGGITNSAANTELMVSDGTNAIGTKLYSASNGNLTLGDGSTAGNRTITATNSGSNANLILAADISVKIGNLSLFGSAISSNAALVIGTGTTDTTLGGLGVTSGVSHTVYVKGNDLSSSATGNGDVLISGGANSISAAIAGNVFLNAGTGSGGAKSGNIGMFVTSVSDWKSMEKGMFIGDAITDATSAISSGVTLWSKSSILRSWNDLAVLDNTKGFILKGTSGGHYWRITVDSSGIVSADDLGTSI